MSMILLFSRFLKREKERKYWFIQSSTSLLRSSGIVTGDSKFRLLQDVSGSVRCFASDTRATYLKKKNRPPNSVNSVCKNLHSALCYETKWMNLTIAILDFGIRLYGGSELSKQLSKCLLQVRKTQKIAPGPNFFMTAESFGASV